MQMFLMKAQAFALQDILLDHCMAGPLQVVSKDDGAFLYRFRKYAPLVVIRP